MKKCANVRFVLLVYTSFSSIENDFASLHRLMTAFLKSFHLDLQCKKKYNFVGNLTWTKYRYAWTIFNQGSPIDNNKAFQIVTY